MQEKVFHLQQKLRQGHLTRRAFLRRVAALGVSVAAAEVLAACATPTPTPTPNILGFVFPSDGTRVPPTVVPTRTPEPPTRTPTPAPPWAQGATWSCPACTQTFATKEALLKHLEAEHFHRLPGIRRVDQPTYAQFLRGVERFDQKDIVFMRVVWDEEYQQEIAQVTPRLRPATPAEAQEGAARVAGAIYTDDKAGSLHPAYYGYFGHLQGVDGMYSWDEPGSPSKVPVTNPAQMSEQVKMMARFYGADLVGVCEINNTWVYSHYFDRETGNYGPLEIPYKYAVVMGIEMKWEEGIVESPGYPSSAATALAYSNMAEVSSKLAQYIRMLGYEAVPSGNDTTQSIPLAIDAGLGELGRNGLLITPQFGARQRICKVYTNLPLEPDQPIDFGLQAFCERCRFCAHNCPVDAIPFGDRTTDQTSFSNRPGILRWPVDVAKCYLFWVSNVADEQRWNDCSNCVRACPWSAPNRNWL
jgi:epoxyqueuosine reductase